MVRGQLHAMRRAARRTTAAGFAIYRAFDEVGGVDGRRDGDLAARRRAFDVRELIMLQKFVAAEESTDVVRQAMSILGGNGVIEDFSCLPRLYRDSAVNELWEGPRNVLLAQIHRDLSRATPWYRASEFVRSVLAGSDAATVDALAAEFDALVACPDLSASGEHAVDVCERWDRACRSLMRGYQDAALHAVDWRD